MSIYDDNFDDNSLDPKWTSDTDTNVVLSETNSEIQIVKTGAHNEYGHIEQSCSHDLIIVTAKMRIDSTVSTIQWSAGLILYWDVDNHASIYVRYHISDANKRHIWAYFNDNSAISNADCIQPVVLGTYYWVRIELTSTQIKYYTSTDGSEFTLRNTKTRGAGHSGAPTLLILGAGWSDNPSYPNADFDNSETGTRNLTLRVDEFTVIVPAVGASSSIVPIMKGLGILATKRKSILKSFTSRTPKLNPRLVM